MNTNHASCFTSTFFVMVLALTLSACAFVDEEITLQTNSMIPPSTVGHGQRVGVLVIDERTTTAIGRRGLERTAEIRAVQDVREVVDNAVNQGLRNQGFTPVSHTNREPVTLEVQLRELAYDASTGFFTGGIHTRATLKAIARRDEASFAELYRGEEEERVVFVPTEASDAERINLALSNTIDKMFADRRLLGFLAGATAYTQQPASSGASLAPEPR
jgi:uncharacterized lipoprotein YajG